MTRARAGVYRGVEAFGSETRALVFRVRDWQGMRTVTWCGVRQMKEWGEYFGTWAEAMAYALEEDET